MQETILIVYLVVAIALVGIILLQQGKGAEMGASFGAGGANTVFGAAGSGNALTKATTILAILFFGIALSISYLNSETPVVVDDIFDESPAVERKSIESELPTDPSAPDAIESGAAPSQTELKTDTKSLESQLPAKEKVEKAAEKATEKTETIKKEITPKAATEQSKKEDDGQ